METIKTKKPADNLHASVLTQAVVEVLTAHLNRPIRIIDATLGNAGHTLALLKSGAEILGIEQDAQMLEIAQTRLTTACPPSLSKKAGSYTLVHGNFKDIAAIARENNFVPVTGIIFDLGVTNLQLTNSIRGFSFNHPDSLLDMRMSLHGPTAADLLNVLRQDQLEELFGKVLDRNESQNLARGIVEARQLKRLVKVADFLAVCQQLPKRNKLHPATRAFLALRMAVNSELENLTEALPAAWDLLAKGGRLGIITFHSTEDRLVKNFFKDQLSQGKAKLVFPKPLVPTAEEINFNPKARSAKLRVLEKIS